jgi:hypothetical protein
MQVLLYRWGIWDLAWCSLHWHIDKGHRPCLPFYSTPILLCPQMYQTTSHLCPRRLFCHDLSLRARDLDLIMCSLQPY